MTQRKTKVEGMTLCNNTNNPLAVAGVVIPPKGEHLLSARQMEDAKLVARLGYAEKLGLIKWL